MVDQAPNEPQGSIHRGGPVEPVAYKVDTHFSWLRTRLSIERTLMSWNRTSLSLISFGFTIYQFFDKFQQATTGGAPLRPEAPRNLGLALVALGTLGIAVATIQYLQVIHYLRGAEFEEVAAHEGVPHWSMTFIVAIFSGLIGAVTLVWIFLGG